MPGTPPRQSIGSWPPDTFFPLLGIYFSPHFSPQSNRPSDHPRDLLPSRRGRLHVSPAGPASRGRRPAPSGAILTKGPFLPLLKLNAIGSSREWVRHCLPVTFSPLRTLRRHDAPGNKGAADLLRVRAPPISAGLTPPSSDLSNLPAARPAPLRRLIRSRAAELSPPICGLRCQSGTCSEAGCSPRRREAAFLLKGWRPLPSACPGSAAAQGAGNARDGAHPLLGRLLVGRRPPSGPFPCSSRRRSPVRACSGPGCRAWLGVMVFSVALARLWLFCLNRALASKSPVPY